MRAEKFEDDTGWHVRLIGDDDKDLLVSEAYPNKTEANRAASRVHDAFGVRVGEAK
jgi:hypothetical protein